MLDLLIVGAGPCGLATAISAQRAGLTTQVLDAHSVVSTITQYPTYVNFFSTAEKLSLGGLPFIISTAKPGRQDALTYYRNVVKYFNIPVRQYERVTSIERSNDGFLVRSDSRTDGERQTRARAVVVATGYFGSPNYLRVPGEDMPHVSHVYREGHEAFDQDVVVVGGGNSAVESALDMWRAGARVTLVHFGPSFDKRIKPWIGPDFLNREREGSIATRWNSRVKSIERGAVTIKGRWREEQLKADMVYVMTGFAPNTDLLKEAGVPIDAKSGIPKHDPSTLETTVPNLFIAGVVVAGFDANRVFIENGRFHGDQIVARLLGKGKPPEPKLSIELDT